MFYRLAINCPMISYIYTFSGSNRPNYQSPRGADPSASKMGQGGSYAPAENNPAITQKRITQLLY